MEFRWAAFSWSRNTPYNPLLHNGLHCVEAVLIRLFPKEPLDAVASTLAAMLRS